MKKGICYIVGAGEWYKETFSPKTDDCVIAVDGGYDRIQELGIIPHAVIGDFDSIKKEPVHDNIIRLNPVKDETDMLYAIQYAKEQGYKKIVIFGATGGSRISHTVANIQTLLCFKELDCILVDKEEAMCVLTNGEITFSEECKGYLSVFSLTDCCEGVYEKGLKYSLENARLTNQFPIGVSNEFVGQKSCISVKKGSLLLVMEKQILLNRI